MKQFKFTLPFPDKVLMPNRKHGQHWAKTQKAKKYAFEVAFYFAKMQDLSQFALVNGTRPVRIVFYMPDRRKRDLDNLLSAMKPSLDGLAQALGVDDSSFTPITISKDYDKEKRGFVEIYFD